MPKKIRNKNEKSANDEKSKPLQPREDPTETWAVSDKLREKILQSNRDSIKKDKKYHYCAQYSKEQGQKKAKLLEETMKKEAAEKKRIEEMKIQQAFENKQTEGMKKQSLEKKRVEELKKQQAFEKKSIEEMKKQSVEKKRVEEKNTFTKSLVPAEAEKNYECTFSDDDAVDNDLVEIGKKVKEIVNESLRKTGSKLSPIRTEPPKFSLESDRKKYPPITKRKFFVSLFSDRAESKQKDSENDSNELGAKPDPYDDPYDPYDDRSEDSKKKNKKLKKSDAKDNSINVEDKMGDNTDSETEIEDNTDTETEIKDSELINSKNVNNKKKNTGSINLKKVQKTKVKENFKKLKPKKRIYSRFHKRCLMKLRYKRRNYLKANKAKKDPYFQSICSICDSDLHQEEECIHLDISNDQEFSANKRPSDDDLESETGANQPHYRIMNDYSLESFLAEKCLKLFKLKEIHPNQKLVIKRILCGRSTLFISTTGSGKSLCYQAPAYCYWSWRKYITIFVSPLISLIEGQMKSLPNFLKGVTYNSFQTAAQNEKALDDIYRQQAQILFVSPEFLVNGFNKIDFRFFPKVAFFCIDEAHCLNEWSTNFRPAYLQLCRALYERLNIQTVLAITATATKESTKIICRNANISCTGVVGKTEIPDNLVLSVSESEKKLADLYYTLKEEPYVGLNSIVIYCTRREETEKVANFVRTTLIHEKNYRDYEYFAEAYHAGLPTNERIRIQRNFMAGKLRIVVTTIAFGMGINKPNIRGIIHYNMPKSFDNYVQEICRAGRDGQQSYCHVLLDRKGEDLVTLQSFIYGNSFDKNDLEKFVTKVYPSCSCRLFAETLNKELKTCAHPVAIPVVRTEKQTDIKSEVLNTILFWMENLKKFPIKLLQPFNSTCTIRFPYNMDYDDAKKIVEQNLTLDIINHFEARKRRAHMLANFHFNVAEIAKLFRKDSWSIIKTIKEIEWKVNHKDSKDKKRNLYVSFCDYSFHFESPGILLKEDIDQVVNELYEIMLMNEKKEINKLRFVYSKFGEFVRNGPNRLSLYEMSDKMKTFLNDHFQSNDYDWLNINIPYHSLPPKVYMENVKYADAMCRIERLIETYGKGYELDTPRKLARILQGIQSPQYPASVWVKKYQFWRNWCCVMDFNYLLQLCKDCLED